MVRAQSITLTLVYTYNGDGLLVARSVSTNVTRYTWDWASPVPELLSDGSRLYLVGLATLGYVSATEQVYYLPDALGSARQLADAQGYVAQRYEYAPFGEPLVAEGKRASLLRYTGEMWDSSTELLYLRARWYDVYLSRFTSLDPVAPDFGDPQSINGYVYVLNNPVNYTDPAGLFPLLPLPPIPPPLPDYRDLTDWLYREMVANAQGPEVQELLAANRMAEYLAADSACDVMNAAIAAALDGMPIGQAIREAAEAERYQVAAAAELHAMALYKYAQLVKNGAIWDFKDETGIKLGPGITLCAGGACYRDIEYSVPGNIHFAYIGVVAGFPGWEIQAGAGVAEMIDPAHRRSNEEEYTGPYSGGFWPWPPWDPSAWNFGDDPVDHEAVTCGIKMAENYGAGMTRSQFEGELARYIGRLARCVPDTMPVREDVAIEWPYDVGYFNNRGYVYKPPPNRCP